MVLTVRSAEQEKVALLDAGANDYVTKLFGSVWGPHHDEDAHYLRILVGKLRHKLGDSASSPRYIVTEPGVGLRFIGRERSAER